MPAPIAAALFALGTSAFFGAFSILVRLGREHANAITGVFISLVAPLPFFVPAALLAWDPAWRDPRAIGFFVLAGMAGPACSRVFLYLSIHHLGVARAMPLTSVTPLFSTALAILVLGERPGPYIWAGTLLIAAGSAALSWKKTSDKSWDRRCLWLVLASVLASACSFLFRKLALTAVNAPLLGVTVSSLAGLFFLNLFRPLMPAAERPRRPGRKAWGFYGACGLLNGAGFLTQFYALGLGDVSIVIPLSSTAPLFSLLLSRLLLRGTERVTKLIVAGTLLIVAGAALISWKLG
ncbi:MAG: DMT family transporter [Candidatus Tectomicrobia bacterium]|uniref:DMT family transporter n=1 Tax=Tectimicrobiota bacterium TaxID=2528274 RepID=A0A932ZRN7_UNCTE|nr:DMT family transporter [Candidatus Tectomicrobia bacterium]